MPNTTVEEVYLINRTNNNPQAPKTFARLVTDSARNQTLDASLNKLIECNALGFQEFSTLQPYAIDDVCFHDRRLWKFTEAKTAGVWDSTKVEEFTFKEYMDAIKAWANTTFAKTNGWYEQLVAGLAENLCGDTIVNAEFYKRKTGGTQSVGSGIAAIKEVRGKSIVWNQLVRNGNFADGNTWWNSSAVVVNNEATVTYASGYAQMQLFNHVKKISGHKYFIRGSFKWSNVSGVSVFRHVWYGGSNLSTSLQSKLPSENNKWVNISFIATVNVDDNSGEFNFLYNFSSSAVVGDTFTARNIFCVDLTLMFGAGNEPATPEEFEKMFPLDYYDYNAGEVIPFAGQNLVTTGFNQWDENYILGYYNAQGVYIPANNQLCSKNAIKVLPNTAYNFKNVYAIKEFDANNNFIISKVVSVNNTITTENNASYMHIGLGEDYGSIYRNDVCVNISNPDRNGTYEPYEKHTLPLDPSQWRDKQGNLVFPYGGMHGAGTAYDYAKVDADGYIRKAVRCFGQVDLGDLTWSYQSLSSGISVFQATIQDIQSCSNSEKAYILNERYITVKGGDISSVPNGACVYQQKLRIYDPSYTDVDTFTTAMKGVMLVYRLATPVEVELATPVYAKYLVDKDGTEEISPANGTTPYTTMANLSILYAMDARGEIKNLPKNYLSKESAENMLNAMVSAGVIASYTMTYDAASGRYVFVIQKNSEQ